MTSELITYYIPNNPNVSKGPIYALYLNHNTNLDLSQIINEQKITLNQFSIPNGDTTPKEETITISYEDYNKLLELTNQVYLLANKRTEDIKAFVEKEEKTTEALSKINAKRNELIRRMTKKGLPQ